MRGWESDRSHANEPSNNQAPSDQTALLRGKLIGRGLLGEWWIGANRPRLWFVTRRSQLPWLGLVLLLNGAMGGPALAEDPPPPKPKDSEETIVRVQDFPLGITILGDPAPRPPDAPVVRISVERTDPVPSAPPLATAKPQPPPPRTPAASLEPRTPEELLPSSRRIIDREALRQQYERMGLVPAFGNWVPSSAYPERDLDDPQNAYPWNPARFSKPIFDPIWKPTPAWPEGRSADNWSPVIWSKPIFENVWITEPRPVEKPVTPAEAPPEK